MGTERKEGFHTMHMADALLAPGVAVTMYAATAAVAGLSIAQLRKEEKKQRYEKLKSMLLERI